MNILFVTRRYPPFAGGAENQIARVAQALAHRGHKVQVICGQVESAHDEKIKNLTVHRLKETRIRFLGTFLFLLQLIATFFKVLSHQNIIVTSQINETSMTTILISKLFNKNTVLRLSSAGPKGNLSWAKNKFSGFLYIAGCKRAHSLIVQSTEFTSDAKELLVEDKKIFYIPNLIPDHFFNTTSNSKGRLPLNNIVWCGRLSQEKNPLQVIEVMKQVIQTHPKITCHMIGSGPLEDDLTIKIRKSKLENQVSVHGFQENPRKFYTSSSLFLLTSLSDAMPNALLEAWAVGLPCVATRVGGVPLIIDDGVSGYLVPPGDFKESAQKIIKLIDDPELAKNFSLAAQKKSYETFHEDKIIPLWEDMFKKSKLQ